MARLILPPPPAQYDVRDQVEIRRLMEQMIEQLRQELLQAQADILALTP